MSKKTNTKKDVVVYHNKQSGQTEKIRAAFLSSVNKECAICRSQMTIASFRLEGVLDGMPPVFICSPLCVIECMHFVIEENIKEAQKNNEL